MADGITSNRIPMQRAMARARDSRAAKRRQMGYITTGSPGKRWHTAGDW